MIRYDDAIATARRLIGTPYSELDCINLIKAVIRRSPGGIANYTTAGTDALWSSYNASPKYRDLTWRQTGLDGASAGMLAFKGKPTDIHDGQPHHVGLVTERGTVIHSSSVKGRVVETPLTAKENWTLLGVHRYIKPKGKEEQPMNTALYQAEVVTSDGKGVNLRAKPTTASARTAKIPEGYVIDVLDDSNPAWWQVSYMNQTGYCATPYLHKVVDEEEPSERSFGVMIPCATREEADVLLRLFAEAVLIGGDD